MSNFKSIGGNPIVLDADGIDPNAIGHGLKVDNGQFATTDELGITGASAGQVAVISGVDASGKPTGWSAADTSGRTLTITCVTTDPGTVTGQTVTVRDTDSSGAVVAQLPYEGSPVSVQLPIGFKYHVSVSDSLRFHGAPDTASGTIGTSAASVTLTYAALDSMLEKDAQTGRYTNASLADWWARQRDGKEYGISQPKGSTVACTKIDDEAGIANPTPGYVGTPAVDPYIAGRLGPFLHRDVNGGADPDGTLFVTSISGIDNDFALNGTNGEVLSMAPTLYERWDESGQDAVTHHLTDTPKAGYTLQEHGELPDHTTRPYMLYAKYTGVKGADNKMHSYSGYAAWNRDVSHNSLITQCDVANTGYSGKTSADDWYLKVMFMHKYATKNSRSVFSGCTGYYLAYACTVAETSATRVIIATSDANNLVVGSSVVFGSANFSNSVLGNTRILSIEPYDASNSAVNLSVSAPFDTTVGYKLSTAPWHTGRCDLVEGDGAYSQAALTNGKEPFVLQGIEIGVGYTEILGNVIISNDGTSGWVPYVNHDSRNESTSVTSDYVSAGAALPTDATDGWKYPTYAVAHEGLIFGTNTGGSTSVGLCDGHYTNKLETTGTREWLSLGYLNDGGDAGLFFVYAGHVLGNANWSIGSRLSVIGRAA